MATDQTVQIGTDAVAGIFTDLVTRFAFDENLLSGRRILGKGGVKTKSQAEGQKDQGWAQHGRTFLEKAGVPQKMR